MDAYNTAKISERFVQQLQPGFFLVVRESRAWLSGIFKLYVLVLT